MDPRIVASLWVRSKPYSSTQTRTSLRQVGTDSNCFRLNLASSLKRVIILVLPDQLDQVSLSPDDGSIPHEPLKRSIDRLARTPDGVC